MHLTKKGHEAAPRKSLLALGALLIAFSASALEASALETTGTTGVFVSFVSPEETAETKDAGTSPETPPDSAEQGQESLPETGDNATLAIAMAFGAMAVCLAIGLVALKARKKRRVDGCAQSRMFAIASACILAAGCSPHCSADAQTLSKLHTENDGQGARSELLSAPLAAQTTTLSGDWDWRDFLFFQNGSPNVGEEVSVTMSSFSPPPNGFSPRFEWGYTDPKTGEETVFAFGERTTVPQEALGNALFARVSDQSGIVLGSYVIKFAGYVGAPILKGSVKLTGTPEVGNALAASVTLETADAAPLLFEWYTGTTEGSCSTLVAQGIQADELLLDDSMRGLYVTCVVSSSDVESFCGTIQASAGPVPKKPMEGTVSIEGERRLGATVSASVSECPVKNDSISISWYLGDSPGSTEERIGEGWFLELNEPSWEGRYLSCVAEAESTQYEGTLSSHDDAPIAFKAPEAPTIETASVSSSAHVELNVAWAQDDPFSPTESIRIEACSPEGEWREIGSFSIEGSTLECEIPIPEIAEWGSLLVRAIASNSGGSSPSEETRITAQMSIAVPVGIEGLVDESGSAAFAPQTVENTGSLNIRIAEVSTVLADPSLGSSRWTCRIGDLVLFDGEFGSTQACADFRTLAPGESCELIWSMSEYRGGQTSLGSKPVLYGTIGYTFRLP